MIITLSSVSAQDNNKPVFSTIEFVSYEVTEKGEIDLDSYTQFTSNGFVKMRNKIFKGIEYKICQLNNEQMFSINRFLKGKKRLSSHIVKDKLDQGMHYGGSYSYFSYKLLDGSTDRLCYITPLVSETFKELHQLLVDIRNENKQKTFKPASTDISKLLKEVLAEHKKSSYMPQIELVQIEDLH